MNKLNIEFLEKLEDMCQKMFANDIVLNHPIINNHIGRLCDYKNANWGDKIYGILRWYDFNVTSICLEDNLELSAMKLCHLKFNFILANLLTELGLNRSDDRTFTIEDSGNVIIREENGELYLCINFAIYKEKITTK